MSESKNDLISFVIPVYNEADVLPEFHSSLIGILKGAGINYEIIYCNDGSRDQSGAIISAWHQQDTQVRLISLSRNFGKEAALAAGIAEAQGEAIITLDGDGQHPVEKIPEFIEAWLNGAQVVIGISKPYKREGWFKHFGSKMFYKLFNKLTAQQLTPGSTDFRLIDREVQKAFIGLNETNRITRGLIDWIGFERTYLSYTTKKRTAGEATYSRRKLISLAANSFVSMTPTPLYIFGYLGVGITIFSFLLGLMVFIEQLLLEDPLNWNFTGTAMLGIITLFLVGIILMSQGILSLYISHINNQSKARPLYVIDHKRSLGIKK